MVTALRVRRVTLDAELRHAGGPPEDVGGHALDGAAVAQPHVPHRHAAAVLLQLQHRSQHHHHPADSHLDVEPVAGEHLHVVLEPLDRGLGRAEHLHPELDLLVLEGDGVVQHEDEVGCDLDQSEASIECCCGQLTNHSSPGPRARR